MPGWIVFDEAARLAGPLHGIVGSPNGYEWSADNSAEIGRRLDQARRRLRRAGGRDRAGSRPCCSDTSSGYAAAVSRRAATTSSVARRRRSCPLLPPLYAIQMTPGVATASGGPRRDAQGSRPATRRRAGRRPVRRRRRRLDLGPSDRARRRPRPTRSCSAGSPGAGRAAQPGPSRRPQPTGQPTRRPDEPD